MAAEAVSHGRVRYRSNAMSATTLVRRTRPARTVEPAEPGVDFAELLQTAARVAKKASPARVHAARVALRRIEALLGSMEVVALGEPPNAVAKLARKVKKARRRLAEARFVHVSLRLVGDRSSFDPPISGRARRSLRDGLTKRLRSAESKARRAGAKLSKRKWKERAKEATGAFQKVFERASTRRRYSARALGSIRAMLARAVRGATVEELHAIRIAIKNARYVLDALGLAPATLIASFRSAQSSLGEVNDLAHLGEAIRSGELVLDEETRAVLATRLDAERERRTKGITEQITGALKRVTVRPAFRKRKTPRRRIH